MHMLHNSEFISMFKRLSKIRDSGTACMISGTTEEGNHLTERIPYFFPPFCFWGGPFFGGVHPYEVLGDIKMKVMGR